MAENDNKAESDGGPTGAEEVKQEAAKAEEQAGDALKSKAEAMVQSPLEAGADALASVAQTAGSVAEAVGGESPVIADYLKSAGQKLDQFSSDLREKSVSELLQTAIGFGRSQPVLMIAGAAIVGFALSRVVKAGLAAPPANLRRRKCRMKASSDAYGFPRSMAPAQRSGLSARNHHPAGLVPLRETASTGGARCVRLQRASPD